jgi:hypothetical protein
VPTIPLSAILDSGCSESYIPVHDIRLLTGIRECSDGPIVSLPDGTRLKATHTASLDLSFLPLAARKVFVLPGLNKSLISVGTFADAGLTTTFTADEAIVSDKDGIVLLRCPRCTSNGLWSFDVNASDSSNEANNATSTRRTKQEIAAWVHALMGSPDSKAMREALKRGYVSFQGFTYEDYLKHEPNSTATAKGHMRETAYKTSAQKYVLNDYDDHFPTKLFEKKKIITQKEHAVAHVMKLAIPDITHGVHSDLTGRLPLTSDSGFDYILVFYCPYANYTHLELLRSRSASDYVAAHKRAHDFFTTRGIRIEFSRTDNESSQELEAWFATQSPPIKWQYVPPHVHRGNRSEKEVGTVKNHFISIINTAHPSFPLSGWEHLVAQVEITLNLLRQSGISYFMSAYHQLHGAYDFVKHPMAPAGTKVIVFDPKGTRGTWANKGTDGFYVAPALTHVGCYVVYMPETRSIRVSNTLSWHPHPEYALPGASPVDNLTATLDSLAAQLKLHGKDIISNLRSVAPAQETPLASLYAHIMQTLGAPGPSGTLQGVQPPPLSSALPPGLPSPDAALRLAQEHHLLEDAAARRAAEEDRASLQLATQLHLDEVTKQELARAPPEDAALASKLAEDESHSAPSAPTATPSPTAGDYHKAARRGRPRTKKSKASTKSTPPPAVAAARPTSPPSPSTPIAESTMHAKTNAKNFAKRQPTKTLQYGLGFRFQKEYADGMYIGEVVGFVPAKKGGAIKRRVIFNDGAEEDIEHSMIKQLVKRHGDVQASSANAAVNLRPPLEQGTPASKKRDVVKHAATMKAVRDQQRRNARAEARDLPRKNAKSAAFAVIAESGSMTYYRNDDAVDFYAYKLLELANMHNVSLDAVTAAHSMLRGVVQTPETTSLANAVLPSKGVAPITLKSVLRGPDRDLWLIALSTELDKLLQGMPNEDGTTTAVMTPIQPSELPHGRKVAYYNPQVKLKILIDGMVQRRARGTYGGNVSDYTGDKSADVADLVTFKLFLNMVASSKGRLSMAVADLKDFYLGSKLGERKEYMFIKGDQLPDDIIEQYKLDLFLHTKATFGHGLLVRCDKTIYGLPQAGFIAQKRLNKILAASGYHPCENTPGLYRHDTRATMFTLVVDDFLIASESDEDREHLLDVLRSAYDVKVDLTAQKYVGITIRHDKVKHNIEISVPGYISNALTRFGIEPKQHGTHAPAPSPDKRYYDRTPQEATTDDTPAVGAEWQKFIQEVVGVLSWYARAVDPTIICAVNKLASRQARPTEAVVKDAHQLLDYVATYPNATIVYEASDMKLQLHSDASWLSESDSRSRAAAIFFLVSKDDLGNPDAINGSIDCYSSIIKSVVGSVFEAEYAALYLAGQSAEGTRNTLADLGFPQDATPIIADNACAVGIANRKVKQRRSKAIDMRYHWIRDRTDQKHFNIIWAAGTRNLADLLTKSHPANHHKLMRPIYVKH